MTAQFRGHPDDQRECLEAFRHAAFRALYYGIDLGTLTRTLTVAETQVDEVNAAGLEAARKMSLALGRDPAGVDNCTYTRRIDGSVRMSYRGQP